MAHPLQKPSSPEELQKQVPGAPARAETPEPDADHGLTSPARRLQHYLDTELGSKFGEEVIEGKWSARRTFGFILITCGLFWSVVVLAALAMF